MAGRLSAVRHAVLTGVRPGPEPDRGERRRRRSEGGVCDGGLRSRHGMITVLGGAAVNISYHFGIVNPMGAVEEQGKKWP